MAVFTEVAADALADWLRQNYDLELDGEPEPVADGIENTNYRIRCTDERSYMFTILEVWDHKIASYCLGLASHLHKAGQPVPCTMINQAGSPCSDYAGKPAAVVSFSAGASVLQPAPAHCRAMGATIAGLHGAASGLATSLPNQRNRQWRLATAATVRGNLDAGQASLLEAAMAHDELLAAGGLPEADCHCDLFRNNVLWDGATIAGIIDFYFAGHDQMVFDLAVACIDWAMDDQGVVSEANLDAMLDGYTQVRALQPDELRLLPSAFVAGSLRFWLSRHLDVLQPRNAAMLNAHDPGAFEFRLRACLEDIPRLLAVDDLRAAK